jgi:DNA polymerase
VSLEIDFETRSAVDLRKRGVYNYMDSPTTVPLMASYSIDGGPIRRWRPPEPCPADIVAHVTAGGMISAHNAAFERLLWQKVLTPRYGWPIARTEQFRCTAATAAAMALPRSLDDLGAALALPVQKDKRGSALIRKFSIPRRPRKNEDPNGLYFNEPHEFPVEFEQFHDYCDDDVRTEAAADRRMIPLSDTEQKFYTLCEHKNDRGIRIDVKSARAALRIAEKAKKLLDREMRLVTGGYVGAVTQPGKLVEWVESQGVSMSSAVKAEIEALLELDDLPANVRRAVEIRQEGAKTSVSKLQAMLDRASADGRVRGAGIYHAASTGREQSVGVNFSNLARYRRIFEDAHLDQATLFRAIRQEDPDWLRFLYGDDLGRPMHLLSDATRGFIWADPGHEFVQADYSGIEGAVIAWSSGEDWKVKMMRDIIDNPNLPDLYRVAAAGIMNMSTDVITKKHPLRQSVGKVSELALGFGGGVAAFHSMSLNYGVKLTPLYEPVWQAATEERREKAVKRYERCLKLGKEKTDALPREAWIACELIKVGWRATNAAISHGWKLREDAVREAIRHPGVEFAALKFRYKVARGFLWCKLPSGRCLAYASPKLRSQVWAEAKDGAGWSEAEVMDRAEAEKMALQGLVRIKGDSSPAITALGVGKDGKMYREFLYGGILAENDTQAVARDILKNGMETAEARGYPVVITVYDEMIAEVPRGRGDLAAFEKLICELPEWAAGLPLTAGGWIGKRYRKE